MIRRSALAALVVAAAASWTWLARDAGAQTPGNEATSCSDDRVEALSAKLVDWSRRFRENERRAYAERGCDSPSVICLNRWGEPSDDKLPDRLSAGRPFAVYVIAPTIDTGNIYVSTSPTAAKIDAPPRSATPRSEPPTTGEAECALTAPQRETLRAAAMPIARLASHPGLERLLVPAASWSDGYWSSANDRHIVKAWSDFVEIEREPPGFSATGSKLDLPQADTVFVEFTRTELDAREARVAKRYEVTIDSGRYHLELGLLVPVVHRGLREIDLVPTPGTRDARIAIREDWHVTGAIAFDYFPLGRARGLGTSFRNCRTRSCWENWLGVQLGAGFGSFLNEWYLGVVFQPVSGLNFGFGASALKGEFLPPGRAEGMQLPEGTSVGANSQYMLRPYLAFTLTLDALQTLDRRRPPIGQFF